MDKINILLVSADPQENQRLKVNQEFNRIYNNLSVNSRFDIYNRSSVNQEDLRRALALHKPYIVHFFYHEMGKNELILVDKNENKEIIDTNTLVDLFRVRQTANTPAHCVTSIPSVSYSPDPDDNVIIATAIAGGADYIITGDKVDLLQLSEVENIRIITARQALAILE